jgi:predicted transcriptional regulator
MITVGNILKVICDDKSLCIFNTIGLATSHDSDILIRNIGLSRKQFYIRVSRMMQVGLICRNGRRYSLTSLGKIV